MHPYEQDNRQHKKIMKSRSLHKKLEHKYIETKYKKQQGITARILLFGTQCELNSYFACYLQAEHSHSDWSELNWQRKIRWLQWKIIEPGTNKITSRPEYWTPNFCFEGHVFHRWNHQGSHSIACFGVVLTYVSVGTHVCLYVYPSPILHWPSFAGCLMKWNSTTHFTLGVIFFPILSITIQILWKWLLENNIENIKVTFLHVPLAF